VRIDTSITSMVTFARNFNLSYRMLKYFNPWLRETYLTNKKGKVYEFEIPEKGYRSTAYGSDSILENGISDF